MTCSIDRYILPLLMILLMAGLATAETPAASYRIQIDDDALASWIEFRGNAPFLRGTSAIDGLILVASLARHAEATGLDRHLPVRLDWDREEGAAAQKRLRKYVADQVTVSAEEIAAYRAENPRKDLPQRIRVRNLFRRLPDDPTAREAVWRDMRSYRQQVIDGADFTELARRHSESETRWRGGLLGNVRPGMFGAAFDEIIGQLEEGEVSEILETRGGLTLLYCDRILPPVVWSEDERKQRAENRVWKAKFDPRWQALLDQLAELARLRIEWPTESPPKEQVVVRYTGGMLNVEAVERLTGWSAWGSAPPPRVEQAIESFALGRAALLHEAELGLEIDATTREHLEWRRRQLLASYQLAAWVDDSFVEPTEAEIAQRFDRHRQRYTINEAYRIRLMQLPRDTPDAARANDHAATILAAIRSGETSFERAAEEHSKHPSAANGGAVGLISKTRLASRLGLDLNQALTMLEVGEVSELVTTDTGIWILRIDSIEPARRATLDEARATLRNELIDERLETLRTDAADRWLAGLEIEYN
ncbi:MAG: peptidylprolyl isomerase [Acidobacteriota bacterium]